MEQYVGLDVSTRSAASGWYLCRDDATAIPRALLERANLGRLRLQHWEAEAPNAIMGWTVFQPRREQWTRQRYQVAPPESLRSRPQLENKLPVVDAEGQRMMG